jgi:predicted nucleotidyltransferase
LSAFPASDRTGWVKQAFTNFEGTFMKRARIDIPEKKIEEFCRRNNIRRLALFGSVLGDGFSSDSDVDVLVEFEPGTRIGLKFFALQEELSRMLGRKVDLNTPGFLSQYFRDRVMEEAEDQYAS